MYILGGFTIDKKLIYMGKLHSIYSNANNFSEYLEICKVDMLEHRTFKCCWCTSSWSAYTSH
jgi:hypothetical protein